MAISYLGSCSHLSYTQSGLREKRMLHVRQPSDTVLHPQHSWKAALARHLKRHTSNSKFLKNNVEENSLFLGDHEETQQQQLII